MFLVAFLKDNCSGSTPGGGHTLYNRRVRRQIIMKEAIRMSARPVGANQMSRDFGIEHMEKKLSMAISERKGPFHYDELCRIDGLSKVRAVRTEDGNIGILGTFMKARKTNPSGVRA
jgi:hypothetical protein